LKKSPASFIERTVGSLAGALEHAVLSETHAETGGLLQNLDPRVKLVGMFGLILTAVSVGRVAVTLAILAAAIGLALLSRISLCVLATRVWLGVLVFTGTIAFPAIFTTPGESLGRVPLLHWSATWQGALAALRLVSRAETAATLAILLVLTTPWTHLLKALRVFRVPVVLVVVLGMTHRYIFLLLNTARDFFEARRCRLVGELDARAGRQLIASSTGVLLGKSLQLSEDVFDAMHARGFRGEVYTLDEFKMEARDWTALAVFIGMAALAFSMEGNALSLPGSSKPAPSHPQPAAAARRPPASSE
jgi:cobalt/nickel transport system permease protein